MRRDKIILVGGGGHALSLMEAIGNVDEVLGYAALEPAEAMDAEWLGDDKQVLTFAQTARYHIAFVYAGLPTMDKRRTIIERYEMAGAQFATLTAASAIVTPNSSVGTGSAILNGAIVNRAILGSHVIINSGAIVEHDCHIGSNTFIGPGAIIGGGVTIGRDCFIGLGSRIKNNVKIGNNVSIGMGTIVTRDIIEPGIYYNQTTMNFFPQKNLKK